MRRMLDMLSDEERTSALVERLQNDGHVAYYATGRTPVSLKADGMRYWYLDPALKEKTVPPTLIAFKTDPEAFFLPRSHNISREKQLELLADNRARVEKEYPGMDLVIRECKLSEWTELAFRHWRETGVRITGKDYGFNYTWTDTYESDKPGAYRAAVGFWRDANGLHVNLWPPDHVYSHLGLASLLEIPLGV